MKGLGSQGEDVRRSLNPLEEGRVLRFECNEKREWLEKGAGEGAAHSHPLRPWYSFRLPDMTKGAMSPAVSKCAPIHIMPVLMMLL